VTSYLPVYHLLSAARPVSIRVSGRCCGYHPNDRTIVCAPHGAYALDPRSHSCWQIVCGSQRARHTQTAQR